MIIVLSGVAGSGKSTLGEALSKKLNWPFYEGDKFHSKDNIEKMSKGVPLSDADRLPWLAGIAGKIREVKSARGDAIFSCSALKKSYRALLRKADENLKFVFLQGSKDEIRERFSKREGHFMPESLIESQFESLEPPSVNEALLIEIDLEKDTQVSKIINTLKLQEHLS